MATLDEVLASLKSQYGDDPSQPAPGFDANGQPVDFQSLVKGSSSTDAPNTTTLAPLPPPTPADRIGAPSNNPPPQPVSSYNNILAMRESGGNPDAHNPQPGQTASGLYGFTDGTFADMQHRHPDRNYTGKNDPRLVEDINNDNRPGLTATLGRPPTSMDFYVAHFLGLGGAEKFLTAPPGTPVTSIVPPDVLALNHSVFYNSNGQPKTVAETYNDAARNMKFPDTVPMPNTGGGMQNIVAMMPGQRQGQGQQTPGDQVYGGQKSAIEQYIASQPQMWAKLAELQGQYKQAATPTQWDKLSDAMTSLQMQQAVANAGMHATAGGVLTGQLPSGAAFNQALEAGHKIDTDARQAKINLAQQDYQMGSGALQAQNTAAGANLALTGGLAKDTAEYNLQSGAQALKMAQFGLDQQKAVSEQLEKMVPNPETRAVVSAEFTRLANPQASYATNMLLLNGIIERVQKGTPASPGTDALDGKPGTPGMQISAKEPAVLQDVTLPDGNGGFTHEIVNTATPEGLRRIAVLAHQPGYTATQIGAPQATTVSNVANVGQGGEGGGGGAALTNPQIQQSAMMMRSNVDAAKELLTYIDQHGGTGPITGSPAAKALASALVQAGVTDAGTASARAVLGKLLATIQNQQVQADLRAMGGNSAGRGGFAMFQQINKGNLDDTQLSGAVMPYLDHVGRVADYHRAKAEALQETAQAAMESRRQNYNPMTEETRYNATHAYPQWHTDGLTAEPEKPPATNGPVVQQNPQKPEVKPPEVNEVRIINGRQGRWDGTQWVPVQ